MPTKYPKYAENDLGIFRGITFVVGKGSITPGSTELGKGIVGKRLDTSSDT